MKINKEGYFIIFASFVLLAILGALAVWLIPTDFRWIGWCLVGGLFIFWLFIVAFFREPKREQLSDDELVYSPCDGTVVVCEPVEENEYLQGKVMQISVFMSVTNVHINWFPISGVVKYFKYHPGQFMVAWHPKSSEDNERTTTVVEHKSGVSILFRQIAGLVARRIVSYAKVGEVVNQNQKCGFIKFGSRVDILVPMNSEVLCKIGQEVTGSQTPLVRLK